MLVLCDSLKGSLSSIKANEIICKNADKLGIKNTSFAFSDGGEGFLDSIETILQNSKRIYLKTHNALANRYINPSYLLYKNKAFIEIASFVGLAELSKDEQNPMNTSTQELSLAFKDALSRGVKKFIIGLGGSSTNDAGLGFLSKMGFEFFNNDKKIDFLCGRELNNITHFKYSNDYSKCKITLACDVLNKLYGKNGAAYIFAGQKGANIDEIYKLDCGLKNVANIINSKKEFCNSSGAAGGIAYAFMSFFDTKVLSGFSYIAKLIALEEKIRTCNYIISAEGCYDEQSTMGKLLGRLSLLCNKYNKELIIFCGENKSKNKDNIYALNEYFSVEKNELMLNAAYYLDELSMQVLKNKISKNN